MSALTYRQIWDDQTVWTFATFGPPAGPDDVRGRLEHLLEEIDEVEADPTNPEEYADCVLLVFDAARRDGWILHQIDPSDCRWRNLTVDALRLDTQIAIRGVLRRGSLASQDYSELWGMIEALADRNGIDADQLRQAVHDKLQVCKQRTWETKVPGQPCRHVKEVPGE